MPRQTIQLYLKAFSLCTLTGAARSGLSFLIILVLSAEVYVATAPAGWRHQDGQVISPQGSAHAPALESGHPVERELAGGQTHSYQLKLAANQFLHLVVEPRGGDMEIALSDLVGKQLAKIGGAGQAQEPVALFWVAESGGVYGLEVRSLEKERVGHYKLTVAELRDATARDRSRVAAQQAFAEGIRLQAQPATDSRHKAIEKYQESVPLWHSAGDLQSEAIALYNIGNLYDGLGEYPKAIDFLNQALPLMRAAGNRQGEARTLNDIGYAYDSLGEKQKALEFYGQALPLKRSAGDRLGEATTLGNMGVVYMTMGESQKALDFYSQALPLMRAAGDRQGEAITLNNVGSTYQRLGEYRKALDIYNQVLSVMRELGDRQREAVALNNVGSMYQKLGEYQKALGFYNQALPLTRAAGDRGNEAVVLNNIGYTYNLLGEYQKALDFYDSSLALRRAIGDRYGVAVSLSNIGVAYGAMGEREKALDSLNQALQLYRDVKSPSGEANALYRIARVERDSGATGEALKHIEAALSLVEGMRTRVASQQLRASYFASVQDEYELYIDLLMRLHREHPGEGFGARALQASERARARGLLELLAEARADIRQGVDPTLLEREHSLEQTLASKAAGQTRLLGRRHTDEQAQAAAKEIDALTNEYEQVEAQIRETSPRYAALTQPAPLGLKEIQGQLLDADTLLLEYALGNERSYVWAVTPTSVAGYELPRRAEIETQARRLYDLLTARNLRRVGETAEQRRARVADADAQYAATASRLSEMVLAPLAAQLGRSKRLLVASDGALSYVPFAALSDPATLKGRDGGIQPLVAAHEIVNLPSASVLMAERRATAGRKQPTQTLAVLADPVFEETDPRVTTVGKKPGKSVVGIGQTSASGSRVAARKSAPQQTMSAVEQAARDVGADEGGLLHIRRLPFSRLEADSITALAPPKEELKATDFRASRQTATSGELARYRIVHFATHGFLDNEHPELSGIVLSLVDESGRPVDGFLRLNEIYNLRLPADLVVLSACQTGLGKQIRGEGLVGLVRGFMYAGAKRVTASLWKVDDEATAELMRAFYKRMLKEGMRPAAALRAAQMEVARERRWQSPYYWAAFELQGEWK